MLTVRHDDEIFSRRNKCRQAKQMCLKKTVEKSWTKSESHYSHVILFPCCLELIVLVLQHSLVSLGINEWKFQTNETSVYKWPSICLPCVTVLKLQQWLCLTENTKPQGERTEIRDRKAFPSLLAHWKEQRLGFREA